jgi:hypothetical protein
MQYPTSKFGLSAIYRQILLIAAQWHLSFVALDGGKCGDHVFDEPLQRCLCPGADMI